MHFEVTSERPCLIDAIGEVVPGEAVIVNEDQLRLFKVIHGVTLQEAKFPHDVSVTCVFDKNESETESDKSTPEEG